MKLVNLLREIAESPYTLSSPTYSKTSNFMSDVDYYFKTDTGKEYYIRFSTNWVGEDKPQDQKNNWQTKLTFFPKELTTSIETEEGGENFGRILATVEKAVKDYITKYRPEYVFWEGMKGHKEVKTGASTKRHRIYNMVMDKMAQGIQGYTAIKGDQRSGLMTSGKIPVPGANKMFAYPEQPSFYNEEEAQKKRSKFDLQHR